MAIVYFVALNSLFSSEVRIGDALVLLGNTDSQNPIFWGAGDTTTLAPVGVTFAQVLARPLSSTNSFEVLEGYAGRTIFQVGPDAGFFDGGIAKVSGVSGNHPAEFYIRAWTGGKTSNEAKSWEEAIVNPLVSVGQSLVFTNGTGEYRVPGSTYAPLTNAPSFTMYPVPEICRRGIAIWPSLFCFSVTPTQEALVFQWTDLGTNYLYTLQDKPALASTNWLAVPGGPWPSRTNQWMLPRDSTAASRFYRVQAERAP